MLRVEFTSQNKRKMPPPTQIYRKRRAGCQNELYCLWSEEKMASLRPRFREQDALDVLFADGSDVEEGEGDESELYSIGKVAIIVYYVFCSINL